MTLISEAFLDVGFDMITETKLAHFDYERFHELEDMIEWLTSLLEKNIISLKDENDNLIKRLKNLDLDIEKISNEMPILELELDSKEPSTLKVEHFATFNPIWPEWKK